MSADSKKIINWEMDSLPIQTHPETKDKWLYIAGHMAMRKMATMDIVKRLPLKPSFCVLNTQVLQLLSEGGFLEPWLEAGDVTMVRMEAMDG